MNDFEKNYNNTYGMIDYFANTGLFGSHVREGIKSYGNGVGSNKCPIGPDHHVGSRFEEPIRDELMREFTFFRRYLKESPQPQLNENSRVAVVLWKFFRDNFKEYVQTNIASAPLFFLPVVFGGGAIKIGLSDLCRYSHGDVRYQNRRIPIREFVGSHLENGMQDHEVHCVARPLMQSLFEIGTFAIDEAKENGVTFHDDDQLYTLDDLNVKYSLITPAYRSCVEGCNMYNLNPEIFHRAIHTFNVDELKNTIDQTQIHLLT